MTTRTSNAFQADVVEAGGGAPVDPAVLRAAGYLLPEDYGADPTGVADSATAINNALWDAKITGPGSRLAKAVWFSPGAIYRVTKSIQMISSSNLGGVIAAGGSAGNRPKIVLDDGATGFGDPNNSRPVVSIRVLANAISLPDDPMTTDPAYFAGLPSSSVLFGMSFVGIDIDCGNNAGAFGVYSPGAQTCLFGEVKIDCSQALGGWWGLLGRQSPVYDLEVIGGVWQIKNDIRNNEGQAGSCVVGLKLVGDNRTVTPIENDDFVPMIIVGFDISRTNSGIFAKCTSRGSASAYGSIVLIDGIVRSSGGTVVNNSIGTTIYLRNVYVTGTNNLVQSGGQPTVTASGTWKRINEYAYSNPVAFNSAAGKYPSESIIDGVRNAAGTALEPVTSTQSSVSAPAVDYIARHVRKQPTIDDGPYVNIMDYGATSGPAMDVYNAYRNNNDDTADSLSAFNAAIAAAEVAGHNRVFVPRGFYYNTGTLDLRKDTVLFGTGYGTSGIGCRSNWQPTSTTYMVRSANDATGTAVISRVMLGIRRFDGANDPTDNQVPLPYDWFNALHWRTGRNSVVWGPLHRYEYMPPHANGGTNVSNGLQFVVITGNGGGRFYGFTSWIQSNGGGATNRTFLIQGTSEPLQIYGANQEVGKTGPPPDYQTEIQNSSNIRMYNCKREGTGSTTYINDSTNIGVFGYGRQFANPRNFIHGIFGTSNNIVIGCSTDDKQNWVIDANYETIIEDLDAELAVEIQHPLGCSVYKRGDLIDGDMY